MAMPAQALGRSLWLNAVVEEPVSVSPLPATFQCRYAHVKLPKLRYLQKKTKPLQLVFALSGNDSDINISSLPPSQTIKQFYSAINSKNLDCLKQLISDDCFFEDYSFPSPFQGKKETMHFLEQLVSSMGQNIEFNAEHIWEGDGYTAGVNWHLEWKKKQVPFTRGTSYFELSRRGERLVIKKARVVIESPIKPGSLALALFAIVTSIFDSFPEAAEWFLKSQEIIFHTFLKVSNMVIMPVMEPLLEGYIRLWNLTARLISFIFKILLYIAKIFYT